MNEQSLVDLLRDMAEKLGSQQALAQKLNVSPQYLNDVIARRRSPGESIIRALGLVKRVEYIRQKQIDNEIASRV